MGGWAGRIPTVKSELGLDDATWGLLLLAQPIGTFLVLLLLPRLVTRTGARALALPGAVALLVIAPVTASSGRPWALALCLLLQGMAVGLLFSPMNALAVLVERAYRRSIMSTFHAWFSIGQLSGGLAGVLAGSAGISPGVQLATTSVILAVPLAATARAVPDDRPDHTARRQSDEGTARRRRRRPMLTRQLVLLAGIALLSSINEGSATQWSAQYSVSLGASVAVGSLTLVCYSMSIALVRLRGDRLVERIGRARFVTISAAVAAVGLGVALAVGTVPMALVGFALLGLGSGCIVPTVIGLAGNQPGVPSAAGVAMISLGEWPAWFLGPPIIGLLAEAMTLRGALSLVVLSATTIALLATRIVVPTVHPTALRPTDTQPTD
jgi:MFS family permease